MIELTGNHPGRLAVQPQMLLPLGEQLDPIFSVQWLRMGDRQNIHASGVAIIFDGVNHRAGSLFYSLLVPSAVLTPPKIPIPDHLAGVGRFERHYQFLGTRTSSCLVSSGISERSSSARSLSVSESTDIATRSSNRRRRSYSSASKTTSSARP